MQYKEAEELRKAWGDKPCPHPRIVKEYHLGTQTGDYRCARCGAEFSAAERREIESTRDVPNDS